MLERLHDFKADLWWRVRHFFRGQFTDEARDSFREGQGKLGKRSQVVGHARFAQIPLLTRANWSRAGSCITPPALVSETAAVAHRWPGRRRLPDRSHRWHLQGLHRGHRHQHRHCGAGGNGKTDLYVADRKTGAPVRMGPRSRCGPTGSCNPRAKPARTALASLTMTVRGGAQGATRRMSGFWRGTAPMPPSSRPRAMLSGRPQRPISQPYIYTDRPVYRPGHTVHIKAVVRRKKRRRARRCPTTRHAQLKVNDADDKTVFKQDLPVSAHGTVTADLISSRCALGYYNIAVQRRSDGRSRQRQFLRRGVQEARVPGHGQARRASACCRATPFKPPSRRATSSASRWPAPKSNTWCTPRSIIGGMRTKPTTTSAEGDRLRRRLRRLRLQLRRDRAAGAGRHSRCQRPAHRHAAHGDRRQAQRPGLPHRSASNRRGQSRSSRPLHRAGHLWLLPRERGANQLCLFARPDAQGKGHGSGLRWQAGADAGASGSASRMGFEHIATHAQRTETQVSRQRCRHRRRRHRAGRFAVTGSGDFEVTASAQTPENRTVEGKPGSGSGTAPGSGTTRTRKPRSWPTKKATRWAIPPICCWSPASRVVGGSHSRGQQRAVAAADSRNRRELRLRRAHHQTGPAQPGGFRTDHPRKPVDHRAKKPESPAHRAHAHRNSHAQQAEVSPRRKRQLRCARRRLPGQAR